MRVKLHPPVGWVVYSFGGECSVFVGPQDDF